MAVIATVRKLLRQRRTLMKLRRTLLKFFVLATLIVLGVAAVLVTMLWHVEKTHPGSIEQWIGAEIQSIASDYLKPKLTFTDFSYEYPLTVRMKMLRLTADDPANPGHSLDILGADAAVITLGEIPQ